MAFALVAFSGQTEAPTWHAHSGVIVDASTERPLAKVTATAYGSTERKGTGLCPTYGDHVETVETKSNGAFTLHVPRDKPGYLVTYCSPVFVTFTRPANDNSTDGTPIEPKPVRLYPRNSQPPQMSNAIRLLRDTTKSKVIGMYKADGSGFIAAMLELKTPERVLVAEWTNTAGKPSVPEARPLSALAGFVENFRTTLDYFRDANPEHFRTEVQKFEEVRRYVDRRSVPEPVPQPPNPIPPNQPDQPVMNDFDIELLSPQNESVIGATRMWVKGQVRLHPVVHGSDTATRARPVIDVLESRNLRIIILVRPVLEGRWWVQPELQMRDGEFQGIVYLGEENAGRGERFEIVVTVAPQREWREGTIVAELPAARSRSRVVAVLRAR